MEATPESSLAPGTIIVNYRPRDQAIDFTVTPHTETVRLIMPAREFFKKIGIGPTEAANLTEGEVDVPFVEEEEGFRDLKRKALNGGLFLAAPDGRCTNLRILDVGGYDGWAARYCLEQGCKEVTVLDNGQYLQYNWRQPVKLEGVRYIGCDVLEWQQKCDVLIAGGLIYHMNDPWRTLWHFRCLASTLVIWTTVIDNPEPIWRVASPDDPGEVTHDGFYTVMWMPSPSGLERLLKRTGWTEIERVGQYADRIAWVAR